MNNIKFKPHFWLALVGAVAVSVVVGSGYAYAATQSIFRDPNTSDARFCESLAPVATRIEFRLKAREKQKLQVEQVRAVLAQKQLLFKQKVTSERQKWDSQFETHIAKMQQSSTVDQQEEISDFKASVVTALQQRRLTTDQINEEYAFELSTLLASQSVSLEDLAQNFETDVLTSLRVASKNCQESVDPASVRAVFIQDIAAAYEDLSNNRKNLELTKQKILQLKSTQTRQIEQTSKRYEAALVQAKEQLVVSIRKNPSQKTEILDGI